MTENNRSQAVEIREACDAGSRAFYGREKNIVRNSIITTSISHKVLY